MIIDANELAAAFQRELGKMQDQDIAMLAKGVADWDSYRFRLGHLQATKELVTWIEKVIRRDGTLEG